MFKHSKVYENLFLHSLSSYDKFFMLIFIKKKLFIHFILFNLKKCQTDNAKSEKVVVNSRTKTFVKKDYISAINSHLKKFKLMSLNETFLYLLKNFLTCKQEKVLKLENHPIITYIDCIFST